MNIKSLYLTGFVCWFATTVAAQELAVVVQVGKPFVQADATNVDGRHFYTVDLRYQANGVPFIGLSGYELAFQETNSGVSGWHRNYDQTRTGIGLLVGLRAKLFRDVYQEVGVMYGRHRERVRFDINSGLPDHVASAGVNRSAGGLASPNVKTYVKFKPGVSVGVGFQLLQGRSDFTFVPALMAGYHLGLKRGER